MKYSFIPIIVVFLFTSCSNKNQLVYLKDAKENSFDRIDYSKLVNNVAFGDILKIDIFSLIPEAAIPYNKSNNLLNTAKSIDILRLEGYLVDNFMMIKLPILGEISVDGLTPTQISKKITQLLIVGGHLSSPNVDVRRINSKFTVLGEVQNPGTFSYSNESVNLFQALGYAGDLTINGKRNLTIIREENGIRKVYKSSINNVSLLAKPYYHIKNNDVIIVDPNFSKVKSAGFIGSPASIASLSSIILSITLLMINK